jgi:hypothetical protein
MAVPSPESGVLQNMSPAVVLAVCIARTQHQRDGKFLEALRTELYAMQSELSATSDAGKALYEFSRALDNMTT